MSSIVRFPGLSLQFNVERVAFTIFNIDIYWYAICIATGIILAFLYCSWQGERLGIDKEIFVDILLCGIPAGVIGGRLYYVIFKWDYYSKNLADIFALRDGGLGIYGAIILSVVAVLIYLKYKGIKPLKIFDVCSLGLLIGQSVGRWGNFFNQEAFGGNTTLPWGMTSDKVIRYLEMIKENGVAVDPLMPVHPTFLYESLWNFSGLLILSFLLRRKKFDGQIFVLYVIWYGFGRMLIEGLRTDSLYLFGVRVSQMVGFLSVVLGAAFYFILRKRKCEKNG